MKLRFRYSKTQNFAMDLDEDSTLRCLELKVSEFLELTYNILGKFVFSLNGVDAIEGLPDSSLTSLGIVGGDCIKILPFSESISKNNLQINQNQLVDSLNAKKINRLIADNVTDRQDSIIYAPISMLEARDNILPKVLKDVFEHFNPKNSSEAITLLVHITMFECGFTICDTKSDILGLPSGWRQKASTLNYSNASFGNFKCTLVLVSMGDVKQALVSFDNQENEISVRIDMRDYVSSNDFLPDGLKKISQMSMLLRNNLLLPLQVAAHGMLGVVAPWQLVGLPIENLMVIAKYLDIGSILSLGSTCLRLNHVMKNNLLWLNILKRDFGDINFTNSGDRDYKSEYKECYIDKKIRNKKSDYYNYPEQSIPTPYPTPFQPNPYQPSPFHPSPFVDPDSPYFGGEIPCTPDNPLFPHIGDPFGGGGPMGNPNPFINPGPLGIPNPFRDPGPLGILRPNRGGVPQLPHIGSRVPRRPRGPSFDFL